MQISLVVKEGAVDTPSIPSSCLLTSKSQQNHSRRSMALPSKQEFEALLSSLNNAAKDYNDANDLGSHLQRMEIASQAKKLLRSLTTPDQIPIQHGINVSLMFQYHIKLYTHKDSTSRWPK